MTRLAYWVLLVMIHLQDPNSKALKGIMTPEWAASYPVTAQEIADEAERDPLLKAPQHTAAIMVVTAYQESRFDEHPCSRLKEYDCDGGAVWGKWQTWKHWGPPTAETAAKLLHDSFRICAKHPLEERLGWYAAGGAGCEKRLDLSRYRMGLVAKVMREVPYPTVNP